MATRRARLTVIAAVLVLLAACGDDDPAGPGDPPAGAVPDFSILDVNPNSVTSGRAVSPRDHLGDVSAWYFGHAT